MKIKRGDNWRSHWSLLGGSGPSSLPVFANTFQNFLPAEGDRFSTFSTYSTTLSAPRKLPPRCRLFCLSQCDKLPSFNNCLFDISCSIKRSPNVTFPHSRAFTCLPLLDQWLCQVKKWRVEWRTCHCGFWEADISGMKCLTASLRLSPECTKFLAPLISQIRLEPVALSDVISAW